MILCYQPGASVPTYMLIAYFTAMNYLMDDDIAFGVIFQKNARIGYNWHNILWCANSRFKVVGAVVHRFF